MWYRARAITSDCGRADLSHGCIACTGWPNRSVRIVSPFAVCSLRYRWECRCREPHQTVQPSLLVENQAGRGGQIASVAVARAAPDGYTFLLPSLATHLLPAGRAEFQSSRRLHEYSVHRWLSGRAHGASFAQCAQLERADGNVAKAGRALAPCIVRRRDAGASAWRVLGASSADGLRIDGPKAVWYYCTKKTTD